MNERGDTYGGNPEARARFPAEIISAVQEATPKEFVVGVRVSQGAVTDEERTWPDEEDTAKAVFESFSTAGADYIHVTEPEVTEPAFGNNGHTLTELADQYSKTVLLTNGGLAEPEKARRALADGADLVTQPRGALANHNWPDRIRQDEELADLGPSMVFEPDASISSAEIPDDD